MRTRDQIMQRDFGICQACKRIGRIHPASEIDHITPLHLGGTDEQSNLQALCYKCHEAKSKAESTQNLG
jgi:5-methylcytosine-specific restriction protein A